MKYKREDLSNIARLFMGDGEMNLPSYIRINEQYIYEICYDLNINTNIIDSGSIDTDTFSLLLENLANNDKLLNFINYYFYDVFDKNIRRLTENGEDQFELRKNIISNMNKNWSIDNYDFFYESNGVTLRYTEFKEKNKIGEGGYCTVYRSDDKHIAYKVLNEDERKKRDSLHRFKREYELMKSECNSGYTLKVYDYNLKNSSYSMEMASKSLDNYIKSRTLTEKEKDKIVIRVVDCMKYLHKKGIIHRDFHPGNILLNSDQKWVVSDFGLAKDINKEYSYKTTSTQNVGRAFFTDPVQLGKLNDGNYKTDMYSLARTISFIMDGTYENNNNKFSSVIVKATTSDLEIRYNDIEEMYNDIINICNIKCYVSSLERAHELMEKYRKSRKFNYV